MASSAELDYSQAVVDVMISDLRAFFKYKNTFDAVSVTQKASDSAQEIARLARGKFKAGVGTISDLQFAEGAVSQAKLRENEAARNHDVAQTELFALIGRTDYLAHSIRADENYYRFSELPPLDELVKTIVSRSNKLRSLDYQIHSARHRIAAANSQNAPTLSFQASKYANRMPSDPSSAERRTEGWKVGLHLRVPLFDGFESSSSAKATVAEMAALQDERLITLRDLGVHSRVSYGDIQLGLKQIEAYKSLTAHSLASLRAAEARYKAGVGPLTDILKAHDDYFSSALDLDRVRRSVIQSSIELFIMLNGLDALTEL